ncbi:MAG TPA: hypothetical protein VFV10_00940 [Gammaproteobacteria bacterium]|nr:hypothetical protein [Gammaproteobacteria bacterium]
MRYAEAAPSRPEPPRPVEMRLLFGVLGAPIAWSVHEIMSVSVIGRRCEAGGLLPWQWATFIGVSVLCLAVAVAAALTAYRLFAASPHQRGVLASEGMNRVTFMAQLGFFLSLILIANIVFFGLVPGIVHPCGMDAILTDRP